MSVESRGASEEYIGEGMVGGYTRFPGRFYPYDRMTGTWKDYDEQVLKRTWLRLCIGSII